MQYKSTSLENVYISGEMYKRAEMNLDRFAQPDFALNSEKTYRHKGYEWPGDNEGRLLMAHILLSRCTHKLSSCFEEIFSALPSHLNALGYLGDILENGFVSEQQIAGNSWLLRSLLEHYEWTKSESTRKMIDALLDHFLIPLVDIIDAYPSSEEVSNYKGKAEGSLIHIPYGKWYMSTDFGCLFIALDGATQAYELRQDEKLKLFIETLITKFQSIDIKALSFQTHATLTCTRALLRYYSQTKREDLLDLVKQYYTLYLSEGMTAAHTNYNWFNIPEFTEPCAVIDSFILAISLWNITGQASYLNDAHLIMYNGVYSGQRINGGFGCDTCAGVAADWIVPSDENFEAWWCCSKRGAEFFSTAAAYLCVTKKDEIAFPLYENMTARVALKNNKLLLKETSDFINSGTVQWEILELEQQQQFSLAFFVPEYINQNDISLIYNGVPQSVSCSNGFVKLQCTLRKGDKLSLQLPLKLRFRKALGKHTLPNRIVMYHGPCLMGMRVSCDDALVNTAFSADKFHYEGCGTYTTKEGYVLRALHQNTWLTKQELLHTKYQLTFPVHREDNA